LSQTSPPGIACPNGHVNTPGQLFCGQCGAPVEPASQDRSTSSTDGEFQSTPEASWSATSESPSPALSKRSISPLIWVGAGVAVVVITLLGWLVLSSRGGTAGPLAETHTITGTLTASECDGGYNIANAAVEIRDEKDKLIGAGTTSGNTSVGILCSVTWSIPDVAKASFYQVTIGTHGGPSYSYAELKSDNWTLDLSL
jgi:hypothetical protein